MRLTKKGFNYNAPIFKKLGQLEDIEEKHNIKSNDDLDKRLIALEIIKEKGVNVYMLLWYFTYSSYEQYVNNFEKSFVVLSDKLLTEEEYNLLKKELFNGKE